jgi:transposase
MRKSFEGLVGVVERERSQQVESGDLFLFFNRRGDRVKVLWFAGDGLVIWYKRLELGTFAIPKPATAGAAGKNSLVKPSPVGAENGLRGV